MAQQVAHVAPLAASSDRLAYLDKPSEAHVFLFSVYAGVIAMWVISIVIALNFHSY